MTQLNRQIAIHEAGHAVAAHALGIGGLMIARTENGFGCGMQVPLDRGHMEEWAMSVVSAAGAAAEQAHGYDPGEGGDEDWQHVVEHVARWAGLYEPPDPDSVDAQQFDTHLRRACDTAFAIVAHRADAVERLADVILARDGDVDTETVLACLDATYAEPEAQMLPTYPTSAVTPVRIIAGHELMPNPMGTLGERPLAGLQGEYDRIIDRFAEPLRSSAALPHPAGTGLTGHARTVSIVIPAHLSHTGRDHRRDMPVDEGIAEIVMRLNHPQHGDEPITVASCDGHDVTWPSIHMLDGDVLLKLPHDHATRLLDAERERRTRELVATSLGLE